MASVLSRIQIIMEANAANYNNELRRARQHSQSTFGKISKAAGKMALGVGAALAGMGAASVKTAMSFETAMAEVNKTADFVTEDGLGNLRKELEELSKTMPLAFEELADIAASGGQMGIAGENLAQFTETIAKMGIAFDISAGQAAESMGFIASAYQVPIEKLSEVGDAINQVSNSSNATADKTIDFMLRTGAAANNMNIAAEATAAMGAAIIDAGGSVEKSGTAVSNMLLEMANPEWLKDNADLFKELGVSTTDFAELVKTDGLAAFNLFRDGVIATDDPMTALREAFKGGAPHVAKLFDETSKFVPLLDAVGQGAAGAATHIGSLDNEYRVMADTTANAFVLIQNSARLVAAALGEAFLPAVKEITDAVIPMIQNMAAWAKENPELIVQLAKITAVVLSSVIAISAIATVVSKAKLAWTALSTAFAVAKVAILAVSAPVAIAIAAVAALVGIGYLLYKNWDTIKEKANQLWSSITEVWNGIGQSISNTWDSVKAKTSAVWDSVVGYISGVWDSITSAVNSGWQAIVYAFENPKETILNILSSLWDNFKAGVEAVFTLAVKIFVGGWIEIFKTAVQFKDDLIQTVISIKDGAVSGFHALVDGAINLWHDLVSSTKAIWQGLISGAIAMIDGIKSAVTSGINAIKDFFSGGWRDVWNDLKVKLVGMVQSVMDAMTNFAKSVANGMVKVKTTVIEKMTEVLSWLRELPSKVFTIGLDFAKGFVNGIKAIGSGVLDAAKSMASGAVSIVKKEIDSHSPSKVTTKLGGDFSQGMANGITKGKKAVVSAAQKMAADAVKAVQDAIASTRKSIALFGNDSAVAAFDYDVMIGNYDNVAPSLREKYRADLLKLEQMKKEEQQRAAISSAIAKRATDFQGEQKSSADAFGGLEINQPQTEAEKLRVAYENKMAIVNRFEDMHTDKAQQAHAARVKLTEDYNQSIKDLEMQKQAQTVGSIAAMFGMVLGESNRGYKAMFAIQKAYDFVSAESASFAAIAKAWSSAPFPANLAAVATTTLQTGIIPAAIQALAPPSFRGQAHDGIANVPREGTWMLDKGERVVKPADNRKLSDFLDGKNKSVGGDNINVNVTVNSGGSSNVESNKQMGRDMGNAIIATIQQQIIKEKRQGGLLYG